MVNKPNILLVDSINEESRQIVKILSDKYSVHIEEEYGGAADYMERECPGLVLLNAGRGEEDPGCPGAGEQGERGRVPGDPGRGCRPDRETSAR